MGESHGSAAMDKFASRLKTQCGKEVTFAIIGDGVAKPLWFPKRRLKTSYLRGHCINFYQNRGALDGTRINGCANVRLDIPKDRERAILDRKIFGDHVEVSSVPSSLARHIIKQIEDKDFKLP